MGGCIVSFFPPAAVVYSCVQLRTALLCAVSLTCWLPQWDEEAEGVDDLVAEFGRCVTLLQVTVYPLSVTVYPLSVTVYPISVIVYPLGVTVYPLSVTVYPLRHSPPGAPHCTPRA